MQLLGLTRKRLTRHRLLVCLKSKKLLCICRFFPYSSPGLSGNIGEFGAKKYFTDHGTGNTIKLFVDVIGNFSGLFIFSTGHSEGEFSRDYLINVATCLFPH